MGHVKDRSYSILKQVVKALKPKILQGVKYVSENFVVEIIFRNFIKIIFGHGFSPVPLLHIFRTPFYKKTSGRLLLDGQVSKSKTMNVLNIWIFNDVKFIN